MNYVYIDESGDLGVGDNSTRYFVIAAICTTHPRKLEKITKKIWRAKPHLHRHQELHAHKADETTKHKFLQALAELEITVRLTVVEKLDRGIDYHERYYQAIAELIEKVPLPRKIIVDRKDTNARRTKLVRKLGLEQVFGDVVFADSKAVKQLQAVDFVSWAAFAKYENGNGEYLELIKGRLR